MASIIDEIVLNRKKLIEKEKQALGEKEIIAAVEEKLASGHAPVPFLSRKGGRALPCRRDKKGLPLQRADPLRISTWRKSPRPMRLRLM